MVEAEFFGSQVQLADPPPFLSRLVVSCSLFLAFCSLDGSSATG